MVTFLLWRQFLNLIAQFWLILTLEINFKFVSRVKLWNIFLTTLTTSKLKLRPLNLDCLWPLFELGCRRKKLFSSASAAILNGEIVLLSEWPDLCIVTKNNRLNVFFSLTYLRWCGEIRDRPRGYETLPVLFVELSRIDLDTVWPNWVELSRAYDKKEI